jgi:hypothetical protein
MNFLNRLLSKRCWHHFTWPRTDADGRHYQVCSNCGIAYEYDWTTMTLTNRLMVAAVANPSAAMRIPRNQSPANSQLRSPLAR